LRSGPHDAIFPAWAAAGVVRPHHPAAALERGRTLASPAPGRVRLRAARALAARELADLLAGDEEVAAALRRRLARWLAEDA
jgi:hypothetical protein